MNNDVQKNNAPEEWSAAFVSEYKDEVLEIMKYFNFTIAHVEDRVIHAILMIKNRVFVFRIDLKYKLMTLELNIEEAQRQLIFRQRVEEAAMIKTMLEGNEIFSSCFLDNQ